MATNKRSSWTSRFVVLSSSNHSERSMPAPTSDPSKVAPADSWAALSAAASSSSTSASSSCCSSSSSPSTPPSPSSPSLASPSLASSALSSSFFSSASSFFSSASGSSAAGGLKGLSSLSADSSQAASSSWSISPSPFLSISAKICSVVSSSTLWLYRMTLITFCFIVTISRTAVSLASSLRRVVKFEARVNRSSILFIWIFKALASLSKKASTSLAYFGSTIEDRPSNVFLTFSYEAREVLMTLSVSAAKASCLS
mmetsp:Transcript_8661/g.30980  ORF Transcript_8661/g.30980 Transcript_8661/m.30980 type:complete len:256 (-) Transcript_8661:1406-2173(-)